MNRLTPYAILIAFGGLMIVAQGMIKYTDHQYDDADLQSYRAMAQAAPHLTRDEGAPYPYRLLGPYLAGLIPLPDPTAFRILNAIACLVLVVLFYRFLLEQRIHSDAALVTVLLFACNRYFFGFFAWDPFQIDDVLAMICIVLSFSFLLKGRWVGLAICLGIGSITREAVGIMVPVSFFYLWEMGTLRRDLRKCILAMTPFVALFILVRIVVPTEGVSMGAGGIMPFYISMFRESIGNAMTPQAWFRRAIWCFLPLTLVPFVFWPTTKSFLASRKYVLLAFLLVMITDLWGIDPLGGDAERQMAPSFLAFYWVLAVIVQAWFLRKKWIVSVLLGCAILGSLHHVYGLFPLPSKRVTLLTTLLALVGVTALSMLGRMTSDGGVAPPDTQTAPM